MNVSVRSYLTSGLAVITAGAIMTAPTEPQHATAATEGSPIALAAQVQPPQLPAPTTLDLPGTTRASRCRSTPGSLWISS